MEFSMMQGMGPKPDLSVDEARRLFNYDADSGILRWRVQSNARAPVGTVAGWYSEQGYLKVKYRKKNYRVHRLAWILSHGHWPVGVIDHINHIRDDNRLCNLRDVPLSINNLNVTPDYYKGVTPAQARITVDGKTIHLGFFPNVDDARTAYRKAALEYFGERMAP